MRKSILFSLVILFAAFSMNAQNVEVPNEQKPLIVKIAASWCPPCGSWGWTFFDHIYDDNHQDAIFLSVHHSGDHANSFASEMTSNFNVFGQPRFIFDGEDQNVSSSNSSGKRTDIENKVASEINSSPLIQTGIDASYSGADLSVDWSVELFEDLSGEFSVAIYLVEKIHVGYQASIGSGAKHKALLRKELSGSTFGTSLFNGSASSGDVFNGSFNTPLESYTPENLEIVSVIWKNDGNDYLVVNTNVDDEVEENITSNTMDASSLIEQMVVYPTLVDQSFSIDLQMTSHVSGAELFLTDLNGRIVENLYTGDLPEGEIKMSFPRSNTLIKGTYIMNFVAPQHRQSSKVIFN